MDGSGFHYRNENYSNNKNHHTETVFFCFYMRGSLTSSKRKTSTALLTINK